jgi:alcohol dehydrogenase
MEGKMVWALKKIGYRVSHRIAKMVSPIFIKYDDPELLSGPASLKLMAGRLDEKGIKKPLIVTDKGVIGAGLLDKLTDSLKTNGISFAVFEDVQPNPIIENIENGTQSFNKEKCDSVIALGGGSPMDCAKIIAARAGNPQSTVDQMRGFFKIKNKLPPIFAIPTTAGTGSEVSIGAIITDAATHEKFAIADSKLIPIIAVLDPELTEGLPPHITAATGMDALTHAVEAYININATTETFENAEKSVRVIFNDLEDVYRNGADREKRENMAIATFNAGAAMKWGLGYVHAISHNMSGLYGVPHGLANAIILPYVLDRSRRDSEKKLARLAQICGLGQSEDSDETLSTRFIEAVRRLNEKIGVPTKIDELKEMDFELIAERALKEANPVYAVPTIMNKKVYLSGWFK